MWRKGDETGGTEWTEDGTNWSAAEMPGSLSLSRRETVGEMCVCVWGGVGGCNHSRYSNWIPNPLLEMFVRRWAFVAAWYRSGGFPFFFFLNYSPRSFKDKINTRKEFISSGVGTNGDTLKPNDFFRLSSQFGAVLGLQTVSALYMALIPTFISLVRRTEEDL